MLEKVVIPICVALAILVPFLRFRTLQLRDFEPVMLTHHFVGHDRGIKKCPRCGYDRIYLCKIGGPKRWNSWFRKCPYCRFKSRAAHTRFGANRLWNKSTTVVGVYEERGDFEWMRTKKK